MSKKGLLVVVLVAAVGLGHLQARGQEQGAPPEAKEIILRYIRGVGAKLATTAEEFPAELYEYRPNEDVRTFGEILMHVARSNDLIASRVREHAPSELRRFRYTHKAAAIATLKESFTAVVEAIEQDPDAKKLTMGMYAVSHGSEHYGNLVVYYRLNGLVPPASR